MRYLFRSLLVVLLLATLFSSHLPAQTATGAIAGSVVVLARRSIYDWPTLLIAVITLAVLFKWKVPEPLLIAVAAGAGLILRGHVL